jgi:hypothetical protein
MGMMIAKTFFFSFERGLATVIFLIICSTLSYAQNETPPYNAKDSIPIQSEDAYQDARLVQGRLARARALRKATRRQRFLERLPANHNPRTATLLALIPGAGQLYNRRYWKMPIVWGGVGTLGYLMVRTKLEFECHKRTYLEHVDGDETTNYLCASSADTSLPDATLKAIRDNTRSDSELLIIGFTIFYGLTIIDAFVDAHLIRFDIDDNLSLQIKPSLHYDPLSQQVTSGIGLAVRARPVQAPVYKVQF